MRQQQRPAGLIQRGGIWHIDKTVRIGTDRVQLRETTGTSSLKEASIILDRRVAETRQLLLRGPIQREHTWSEAAAEYVADLERKGKDSARALLDIRMVLDAIGELPLSHVHQRSLQEWIDDQRGRRASGTVARALRTVVAVLNYAARVLRDGNQPWRAQAVPRLSAPDWGERQPVRLTWEEQDRLLTHLPDHLIGPVLFALATGARQHEIVTLSWGQHRPVEGLPEWSVWWIPPEIRKANARKRASQQSGRYLIANAAARAVIAGQPRNGAWVFPSPIRDADGKAKPVDRFNNRAWRAACRTAGLTIRFHDLRHTFGERMATAGVPFDARKTLLGHEHHDITAHYSTPGLSRLLEEAERVQRPPARLVMVKAG